MEVTMRPLELLVDSAPVATLLYDDAYRVVDANAAAVSLFGYSLEELRGRNGFTLVAAEDAEASIRGLGVIAGDRRRHMPSLVHIRHADGSTIPVLSFLEILSAPVDGVHYIVSLPPIHQSIAIDGLIDAVLLASDSESLVTAAITALEATGHYRASFHSTQHLSGVGVLRTISGPIGEWGMDDQRLNEHLTRAMNAEVSAYVAVQSFLTPAPHVSASHVSAPEHRGAPVVSGIVLPVVVRSEPSAVFVVWTLNADGLGPFGQRYVERVASLTGLAMERMLELQLSQGTRKVGDLELDVVERRVRSARGEVRLTPMETSILNQLCEIPGRIVSREQLTLRLFGSSFVGGSRACDVHVMNLRKKLERTPELNITINTSRGVGYSLEVHG
jgi:PAS domain S-box-containing protein